MGLYTQHPRLLGFRHNHPTVTGWGGAGTQGAGLRAYACILAGLGF